MHPRVAISASAYAVHDISTWAVVSQEARGLDPKDWVAPPEHAADRGQSNWWLFKPNKAASYRRCDAWSEKIAAELAVLIGLPAARVELARGLRGVGIISRNVTPDGWSLESGDTLLSERPGYVSCAGDVRSKNRVGHNLDNIHELLEAVGAPGSAAGERSGFDVFAGYLVFDAWIANTDRHAINWGVMTCNDDGRQVLAPSFDHGSALASGVQEAFLATVAVEDFAVRGMAHRFENGRALPLVDLALQAVAAAGAPAHTWIERLGSLDTAAVETVVESVPGVSDVRRRFLGSLLGANRRRLLS